MSSQCRSSECHSSEFQSSELQFPECPFSGCFPRAFLHSVILQKVLAPNKLLCLSYFESSRFPSLLIHPSFSSTSKTLKKEKNAKTKQDQEELKTTTFFKNV